MTPRPRRRSTAFVFAVAMTSAGCLTASQESRVQTDLDQVRKQMFDMQKDTAAMVTKLAAIEEKLPNQDSAQPAKWADMQALLQTLTDEVRTLGARLDDNGARMGSLSRDISATRDQYRALEARIAVAMGEKGPIAPAPPASLEPPVPQGQAQTQAAPPKAGTESSRVNPSPAALASMSGDDAAQEDLFRGAYSDFTRGNYDLALAGFQDFLKKFPSSALSAGAMYYSGECLFSQQKYQEAADAFGRAVAEHPTMENAAAAYLKRGLSLLSLKQTAPGVVQLQHVIDAYPRSEEARIAADRLRQLGLRDH